MCPQYPKYQSSAVITISSRRDSTISPLLCSTSHWKLQRVAAFLFITLIFFPSLNKGNRNTTKGREEKTRRCSRTPPHWSNILCLSETWQSGQPTSGERDCSEMDEERRGGESVEESLEERREEWRKEKWSCDELDRCKKRWKLFWREGVHYPGFVWDSVHPIRGSCVCVCVCVEGGGVQSRAHNSLPVTGKQRMSINLIT